MLLLLARKKNDIQEQEKQNSQQENYLKFNHFVLLCIGFLHLIYFWCAQTKKPCHYLHYIHIKCENKIISKTVVEKKIDKRTLINEYLSLFIFLYILFLLCVFFFFLDSLNH